MGASAKKTLLAALAAWLLTRALRRVVGVALLAAILAAAATIAGRHGVDSDGVRRVMKCETRAITGFAKQLRDAGASSSPSAGAASCARCGAWASVTVSGPLPLHDRAQR